MKAFISTVLVAIFAVVFVGCGKDDDGSSSFVPNLSQQWTNKADATNTFFFLPANTNVNTATFTGNENPPGGGAQLHFTGSFTNRNIQFTYDAGSSKTGTYTGTINDASTVITLNSTQLGNLVLEKK